MNRGLLDSYLENLGYCRISMRRDNTCFYRIIAKQVYNSQSFHKHVFKEVVRFVRDNRHMLSCIIPGPYEEYLDRLSKYIGVCGFIEMNIVSLLYNKDVFVFEPKYRKFINVTHYDLPQQFLLCRTTENHFDALDYLESIETPGFVNIHLLPHREWILLVPIIFNISTWQYYPTIEVYPQNFVYSPAPSNMIQPYTYPAPAFAYTSEDIQCIYINTPENIQISCDENVDSDSN